MPLLQELPYLLGETVFRMGRGADAERWAREALRRNPNEPRVHQLLQQMQKVAARN
jgi:Flp pilus assembly protein TadD